MAEARFCVPYRTSVRRCFVRVRETVWLSRVSSRGRRWKDAIGRLWHGHTCASSAVWAISTVSRQRHEAGASRLSSLLIKQARRHQGNVQLPLSPLDRIAPSLLGLNLRQEVNSPAWNRRTLPSEASCSHFAFENNATVGFATSADVRNKCNALSGGHAATAD